MFAVDACDLATTGGSTFVVIAGLFVLVAGVIVTRWVRQSAGRMSVVVAPLVLLGGLVLAPQVADLCASTTTTVATSTTTTVATSTTTTVAPALFSVGDTGPGGGTIVYVDLTRAPGSKYFEVACAGWSDGVCAGSDLTDPGIAWGCFGTLISDADGTAIGTGAQNTAEIVAGCPESGIAAKVADALVLGGQTDWFLPSQDELNQMYVEQTAIGGFSVGDYWSSSESDANYAWNKSFYSGWQYYYFKYYTWYVRPVRAF